jgi:hypothetical protein
MNDENGIRPRGRDAQKDLVIRADAVSGMAVNERAQQQVWRGIRAFGLFLAFIHILELTCCSGAGRSTAGRCDQFPFALLTFFSCLGDSLAEWFCILFLLITLRTLLVTAKVEYKCYRKEQIIQRNSGWDYYVKYGHRHHLFDKNKKEETVVQRTTRIAKQIAKQIWRWVRNDTFLLVLRAHSIYRTVRIVLLVITHTIMVGVIPLFLGTAIRGMLRVVLLITLQLMRQFRSFVRLTISLMNKILHF